MKRLLASVVILFVLWMSVSACFADAVNKSSSESKKTTDTVVPPPRRDVPGKRFPLSLGNLYVPEFFDSEALPATQLVLFFHGASWCAEQNHYDARKNAVLVSVSVKNYGYPAVFKDPSSLRRLLEETTTTLAQHHITIQPLGKICLASFSGGYSAIREILKQPEFYPRISDIVLADSLYGPRVEGFPDKLDPEAMAPFLEFARRATLGQCTFWFSHLYPPEERHRTNTTTLAASYLIDHLGAERKPTLVYNSRGARLLYRADLGDFHVLGYAGMTMQDHLEHFYALSDLLRETSLLPRALRMHLPGFKARLPFNEQIKTYIFDPNVKVHINAPPPELLDPAKPMRIILYALPNGNTTEQTIGKKVVEGVDWHFGIQHIGAQTRRLREIVKEENIVVVYLEAESKSWPLWRKKHPNNGELIQALIESILKHFDSFNVTIHLSGHSGGGSFIFGYLNSVDCIPDSIERISFLDSDYGYSDEEKHGDRILEWLKRSPHHYLSVICYDDRNIRLNGKLVVGPQGGTYRKTHKMVERIQQDIDLAKTTADDLIRYRGLNGQIDIIIHTNPENLILHTVLVGDMNGFIHAMTVGTVYEDTAAVFNGPLAYEKWIQSD